MSSSAGTEFADWQAIRELTATYNRCFDNSDAVGWAGTFLTSGRLEVRGEGVAYTGHEELADFCRSRGWGILHMTLDPELTVDGDHAEQRCNLLMFRRHESQERPTLLATGRYSDTLVRTSEGWRFDLRAVQLDTRLGAHEEMSP
ncbi:nuclear transport factor 2 family protein [Rhodococcus koreensis]|uniref:nuclear transport factor 2 family protein n=1 Tax=Rhodococcus koreensis TaxID=99653 RepID=UPI003670C82A